MDIALISILCNAVGLGGMIAAFIIERNKRKKIQYKLDEVKDNYTLLKERQRDLFNYYDSIPESSCRIMLLKICTSYMKGSSMCEIETLIRKTSKQNVKNQPGF